MKNKHQNIADTFSGMGNPCHTDDSLLAALCKANGQQGGTIHQFFRTKDFRHQDWATMQRSYWDYTAAGITFESRASFDKLAEQCHLTINWE